LDIGQTHNPTDTAKPWSVRQRAAILRAGYLTPNIKPSFGVILLLMTAKFSQPSNSAFVEHQMMEFKKIAVQTHNYVVERAFLDSNHELEDEVALIDRLFGDEIAALFGDRADVGKRQF
jgi:hypothetical protein